MATDNERFIPVIIGVGQVNDRPADDAEGLDPPQLMAAALREAEQDAGVKILSEVESFEYVPHLSFANIKDTAQRVAKAIGAAPRILGRTEMASGDSPMHLLNDAANRIGRGEIDVAAIAGAEASRTYTKYLQREAAQAPASGEKTDEMREFILKMASPLRIKYGLLTPTDVYPLYENGTRAKWGQTLAEAQTESGRIWSDFSKVAAANPGAWVRKAYTPQEILTPSADNRVISFPYNKLMVANNATNQGAAVIVTSLAKAKALGIPEARLVYVGPGAAAHEDDDFLARDTYARSAGMTVSIEKTLRLNALKTSDLDHVELYSCFPCVPKMARRVLDWPLEKPMTVFGGLTFGGAPVGNCMMHAAVCMTQKLRERGTNGLIFANGGFATHNHSIVLTRKPVPAGTFPQDYDYQRDADALRGAVPKLLESHAGAGIIETYIVPFDRKGEPQFATIVARTPNGDRFLASVPSSDTATLELLTSGKREPVGTRGTAVAAGDRVVWQSQSLIQLH